MKDDAITADPITVEIIRHAINAIPNLIDANIMRTAFSPLINEYKDFAVGIVDHEGRLISQSKAGIPVFIANSIGVAVRDGLELYGSEDLLSGDIVITNWAGTQGQHLNNVVMYTPIRIDGELAGFMSVVMHWMDVGGIITGSCISNDTTDIYQEGIQFRTVKLRRAGQPVPEIYRMIRHNTRFPDMVIGDVESQAAGCLMGCAMVEEVIRRFGLPTFRLAVERIWDQAEKVCRAAIRAIPDGTYTAESFLDNDGRSLDQRIPVKVSIHVSGDAMVFDFSEIGDEVVGPLNAGRDGGATAAARIAAKYLLTPIEPANEGDFRAIRVDIPDGKFLSARPTAPMGGSGSTLPTVVDTIFKALAPALPARIAAAHHGTYAIHVFIGRDPTTGGFFQHVDTGIGGWGATCDRDGPGPYRSLVHGDTVDVPAEMQEGLYPLRLENYSLRPDSGGAGRHRGGLGIEKLYRVLAPCRVAITIERSLCAPWGLFGAEAGKTGFVEIRRPGHPPEIVLKGDVPLAPGDLVYVATAGGGGYGIPSERRSEDIEADVRAGYVTEAAAQQAYGGLPHLDRP
jgi:N-methylhydantoinase B